MGYVLGTLGVGVIGFVIGTVVGARLADGDYEPVAINNATGETIYRRRDDEWVA